jgi:exonuclease III
MVNDDFIDNVKKIDYLTDVMWSDHCPVLMEVDVS